MRMRCPTVIVVLTLFALVATPSVIHGQIYDVIIRHGRVIDGTGNPWFRADVALNGERIAAIGDLTPRGGRPEISDCGDSVSVQGQVGHEPRVAGSVDHPPVSNNDVISLSMSVGWSGLRRQECGQ